uniref:Uncharacterized protein n=1 Tax=Romanomermis culicivorax TaxID=13658 RepID=A0A915JGY2_ROMCU
MHWVTEEAEITLPFFGPGSDIHEMLETDTWNRYVQHTLINTRDVLEINKVEIRRPTLNMHRNSDKAKNHTSCSETPTVVMASY